jgi:hypothetical protein
LFHPASDSSWGSSAHCRAAPEPDQRAPKGGTGNVLAQRSARPGAIDEVGIAIINSGGVYGHHWSPFLRIRRRLTTRSGTRRLATPGRARFRQGSPTIIARRWHRYIYQVMDWGGRFRAVRRD